MTNTDERIEGERLRRALSRDAELAARERFEHRAVAVGIFLLLAGAFLAWCGWGPLP